jgi:hypothetical protein
MTATARLLSTATLAALIGLALPVAARADDDQKEFTLVERAASDTVTDLGAKGDSVGDLLTFANELYDQANAKKVGSDNGWCIRTAAGKAWECTWTTTLEDGQITVQGPFYDGGDSVLAVTGGTGRYSKARGEMKLHARDAQGSAYDFTYRLKD